MLACPTRLIRRVTRKRAKTWPETAGQFWNGWSVSAVGSYQELADLLAVSTITVAGM